MYFFLHVLGFLLRGIFKQIGKPSFVYRTRNKYHRILGSFISFMYKNFYFI